jgi:hypothetical protein
VLPIKLKGVRRKFTGGIAENLDIGVPVFRIFLYVASPSLVLGFFCRHQNYRDPEAPKTVVQPRPSVPTAETFHGTSFLLCIEKILGVVGFIMLYPA